VGAPPAELPDHEQKEIAALAKEADAEQLARLFDLVHGALGELGRAFEPQLALEVALLKGVFLAPGAQVSELLARVEVLSRGGPIPATPAAGGGTPRAVGPVAPPKASAAPSAPPAPIATATVTATPRRDPAPLAPSEDEGRPPVGAPKSPATPRDDPSLAPIDRLSLLVKAAVAKSPRIGTALKNGRLKSIRVGEVALAYPQGDFRAALLAAEKITVDALLTAHFGPPTQLRICEGEEAGSELSIAEREAQGTAERTATVKATALDSAAVKEALRLLGGQVEEVRVLGDPANK
jgi:DNA polymerase-3 subunit gamma/tau